MKTLSARIRTALVQMPVLLGLTAGAVWAQPPSPLPLDPAQLAGTEAFISQTVNTQLRGVEEPGNPGDPSGLNFQDIGLPAALEYNNIGYDPVTRYLYGVEVVGDGSGGGNMGLVRIGLDPADPTQILVQPLGWPGYPNATAPWGGSGSAYPRYDAGDVDPDSRLFYVHTQGQQVGNGCLGNPSVCTDRVRSFDIDALPLPGEPPADLTPAYGVSRVFKAVQGGPALDIDARVADWAYRDGKLYGGDAASGMLAVNTPNAVDDDFDPSDDNTHALFNRFDFDPSGVAPALDTTIAFTADAYGAAWFIGDILYLYKNGGENAVAPKVYKIDLQIDEVTGDPFPKIIEIVENVDVVTRNDGASFMAQGPVPFECTDTAYLVQADGQTSSNDFCADNLTSCPTTLSYIDQTAANFNIVDIANTGVDEINAIGYNTLDNFLYGVQVQLDPVFGNFPWTNQGIVRIEADGTVTNLGNPTSSTETWPSQSFNAGDVMPGTNTMYVHLNGGAGGLTSARKLYIVDLATMTFTSKAYSGPTSNPEQVVLDWAAHPTNGLLYGADRQGQIAVLDPSTGVRTDGPNPGLASFPTTGSDGYGAAWFNSAGELFVYQNSGTIYKIDLGLDPSASSGWTVVSSQSGESTTRNDGAACAAEVEPAALTVSKTADTAIARTYDWTIDKTGYLSDQLVSELTLMPGQSIQVSYKVAVDATALDVNSVGGAITIVNNTQQMATIDAVTDQISGDTPTDADVDCQVSFQYDLPAGETLTCGYGPAELPDASTQTNTATVTTSGDVAGGTATATVDFASATLTEIDECIDVSDDKGTGSDIFLEEVCGADKVITYYLDIGPFSDPEDCGSSNLVTNTASFVTGDQSLPGSDDWTIPITVDCEDGCSLTPGYWKTHSEYGPAPYDDTWALLEFEAADTPFFLSGQSYYEVLWTEPQGDAYYILAHAYIAAQLNKLNGADPTDAQDDFDEATALFTEYTPAEVTSAKGKNGKAFREQFITLATTLDNYNNGYIGPGHCSEEGVYIVPGGDSSLIHVGDLDASASSGRHDRWNANVTITVHDASEGAVADATVWGEWSDGSSGSCPTNNSGQCAIDRNNIRSGDSITFTVTDVTHGAFTYSAADNHDEEDGDASDGTSIAVLKP